MNNRQLCAIQREFEIPSAWIARKTGHDRSTVWRWRSGKSPVPMFVKTILEQEVELRKLRPVE